jgi:hypothetical protein
MSTYLINTIIVKIQKISDATPSTSSFAGGSALLLWPLLARVMAYVYRGLVPMST